MRVLDLFCGAGGAAMGLHRAWPDAEIMGIDIKPQPRYPFKFLTADALQWPWWTQTWDFIWASPVCKRYTQMTNCRPGHAKKQPDQISETRKMLERTGIPYTIENVPGAPLLSPIELCGTMFGLKLYRHRLFECNFPCVPPTHSQHENEASRAGHWERGTIMSIAGHAAPVRVARESMGIDWMTRDELSQAIPPAYSEYIAKVYAEQRPLHREAAK